MHSTRSQKKATKDTSQQSPPFSMTKTTESGAFIRTTIRHNNKRKTKTERFKKNDKKVVLGFIGDFEVYAYPYDFPDRVFIGKFPVSTQLENANINTLFSVFNRARAFLNGDYFNKPNSRKAANSRRQQVQTAYNLGLNDQRSKQHA